MDQIIMRGKPQAQPDFLTVINLNQCVPEDHPLRAIKRRVDAVLKKLSPLFEELYEELGRPSIPPEQLLKARVLTALYSVRSERLFCGQLGYNLLWLWFLDREFAEGSFDHSIFAKNYDRVLSADVARLFFLEVYDLSRQEGWTSDEHFTADGTLIESWASLKSFVRKDGADDQKVQSAKDEDPGNPTINFRGEKRRNDTHQSTTDPESVLYRKASGQAARLCLGGHVLMENRNGLCADFTLHNPITDPEPVVALQQADAHAKLHGGVRVKTMGSGQGVSPERICARLPGPGDCAPRRVQGQGERGRVGRTHHDPAELPSQSENQKTGGGDIWLAQDGGWIQTEPVSGTRTDASLGLLCSGHLQFVADGTSGTGGHELIGGSLVRPPAKRHQDGAG